MKSRPPRKLGFALNQEDYIDHVRELISRAFWYFISARLPRANDSNGLVFWLDSEVLRRIDFELPNWISIAPANGRFDRAAAIEAAIGSIERHSGRDWKKAAELEAKSRKVDAATLLLPSQRQLETEFFSRARAISAAALQTPPAKRMSARPMDVLAIWEHVSTALTFQFEIEIATANSYLTHVIWWEDRVGTHLDDLLADYLDIYGKGHDRDLAPAIRAGLNLVPVQRIWDFAMTAIASQLAKQPSELLLPERDAIETSSFAMVRRVCVGSRRNSTSPKKRPSSRRRKRP